MSIYGESLATLVAMTDHEWSTLAGRVAWVISSERVKSARDWGIKAGKSGGYVGRIKNEPNLNPTADVLEAMARVAGVSVQWLRFGDGGPDGETWVERESHDPNREIIVAMAKEKKEDPAVIRMLETAQRIEGPMALHEWEKRLVNYRAIVKRNYDNAHPVVPDDGAFDVDEA